MNTPIDIDSQPAGREMNALMAQSVMGWKVVQDECSPDGNWPYRSLSSSDITSSFCPSYNISAAMELAEKFDYFYLFRRLPAVFGDSLWECSLKFSETGDGRKNYALAETAPLAVCRAALKAIKKE